VITLKRESGRSRAAGAAADDPGSQYFGAGYVVRLDALAFEPIWHHNRAAMESAARQAATFTVLEETRKCWVTSSARGTWTADTWRGSPSGQTARAGLGAALVAGCCAFSRSETSR